MAASQQRPVHDGPHPGAGIPAGARLLLDLPFGASDLVGVREAVSAHASSAGLPGQRTRELVLVAHELATNVVRHGGGQGRLRLWAHDSAVLCQVTDNGPGLREALADGRGRPAPGASGGRGLWLVETFADTVTVHSDELGGGMDVVVTIHHGS